MNDYISKMILEIDSLKECQDTAENREGAMRDAWLRMARDHRDTAQLLALASIATSLATIAHIMELADAREGLAENVAIYGTR